MDKLLDWCRSVTGQADNPGLRLETVSGDASFRSYYRLLGGPTTLIAVNAPPETEKNHEFVQIAGLLGAAGVQAPEVLASDFDQGFLLLSDLGNQLLLPLLNVDTVDGYYASAMATLHQIRQAATATADWQLPAYSAQLLRNEMALFPQWFLHGLLGIDPDAGERALIERTFDALIASAEAQPQVFVHRDFHARNLMVLDDGALGVIDFQDAVVGPLTYDLVSLLRDCYVAWAPQRVQGWALCYRDEAVPDVDRDTFLKWFDWMGLQRHIKVLGIFARLFLRDGKPGYLPDLPLVMHYTRSIAGKYPALEEFVAWFEDRVQPLAETQPWYRLAEIRE